MTELGRAGDNDQQPTERDTSQVFVGLLYGARVGALVRGNR